MKASIDVECLDFAVSTILKCRETLRFSHIFGFFTVVIAGADSNYAYLIVTLQDGLQMIIEKINNSINRTYDMVDPNLVRRLCTVALKARQNLLEAFVSIYENLDLEVALEKKLEEEALEKEKEEKKKGKGKKKGKKGEGTVWDQPMPRIDAEAVVPPPPDLQQDEFRDELLDLLI